MPCICNYQPKVKAPRREEVPRRKKSRERDTDNFHFAERKGSAKFHFIGCDDLMTRKLLTPCASLNACNVRTGCSRASRHHYYFPLVYLAQRAFVIGELLDANDVDDLHRICLDGGDNDLLW
jgi:hypothetical protein